MTCFVAYSADAAAAGGLLHVPQLWQGQYPDSHLGTMVVMMMLMVMVGLMMIMTMMMVTLTPKMTAAGDAVPLCAVRGGLLLQP
jgi:hypothetical protein